MILAIVNSEILDYFSANFLADKVIVESKSPLILYYINTTSHHFAKRENCCFNHIISTSELILRMIILKMNDVQKNILSTLTNIIFQFSQNYSQKQFVYYRVTMKERLSYPALHTGMQLLLHPHL